MVQEEDSCTVIEEYAPMVYEAQIRAKKEGKHFNLFLHAGESNLRTNENIYDAIVMGTKRIGHGFHIAHQPNLIEEVKRRNICLEVCPISNFVLGYALDLRTHPVRGLLQAGVPCSISSDDPALFHYDGVTLDFCYAFLAWELDLADLKQLCVNSIDYASISNTEKHHLRKFFEYKWKRFLDYIIGKY
jgi:adenosine deaminase CECR1